MVILGIILAIIGLIASIGWLLWLGVILIVVGLILNLAPGPWAGAGTARRRYW